KIALPAFGGKKAGPGPSSSRRRRAPARCAGPGLAAPRRGARPRMEQLPQHLLNGLLLGATYSLLGVGLTLVFGLMHVVNFAHGEFYTLGAYGIYAALVLRGGGLP